MFSFFTYDIELCLSIVILLNQTIFERKLKTEHTYKKTIELTRIFKNVTKVHVTNLNLMKIWEGFRKRVQFITKPIA